jgi:putative DNA primase/helicase
MMDFSGEGFEAWKSVHNKIEADLGEDGELSNLRDLASKSADNISRLAALFTLFNNEAEISKDSVVMASRIVIWHLHEARRFFGEIHTNPQDLLAGKLDKWLLDRGESTVHKSIILTNGPNALRKKESLDLAIIALEKLHRIRVSEVEKKTTIQINPVLLRGEK